MQAVPSSDGEVAGVVTNETGGSEGIDCEPSESNASPADGGDSSKLVLWQGVALLTADCLGVGILALPNDIKVLGYGLGLGFLLSNFPVNFYAGDLLNIVATAVEGGATQDTETPATSSLSSEEDGVEKGTTKEKEVEMTSTKDAHPRSKTIHRRKSPHAYSGVPHLDHSDQPAVEGDEEDMFQDEPLEEEENGHEVVSHEEGGHAMEASDNDLASKTNDLISISKAVFDQRSVTQLVVLVYYLNLFLVLGDYVLVMARAVAAMFLDEICIPTAGIIASLLMLAVCQWRTMALLGQNVSLASLTAMIIVLLLCLFHHRTSDASKLPPEELEEQNEIIDVWSKLSAFASIGFAVGSQKLFLNIRHELRHREKGTRMLAGSLSAFGVTYLLVVFLAGSNPPSFLFDAIPEGRTRRIAGFLLWGHVAVSYAINSQALCSSMERFLLTSPTFSRMSFVNTDPKRRWFYLTFAVALSSYSVANAVPFFKDLVALIGSLTTVPVTLTLPALLYRKFHHVPVLCPTTKSWGTYALFLYSIVFLVVGLIGALGSIDEDWMNHGHPFACQ